MNQKFQQAREMFKKRYGVDLSDARIASIQLSFPKPKIRLRTGDPYSQAAPYNPKTPFLMRDRIGHTYAGLCIEQLYMGWLARMSEYMEDMTRQPGTHWAIEMAHKIRRAKREDKKPCRTIITV